MLTYARQRRSFPRLHRSNVVPLNRLPYWRLSLFYLIYFAALGAWLPYWPLYLSSLDFNAEQIGYLAAAVMATKIVAPGLWGWWADRSQQQMGIIRFGALGSALIFAFALWRDDFWALLLIVAGFSFFWNAILSQFDVVTLNHLGDQYHRYSLVRVWGSIGFIVVVGVLGWLFGFADIVLLPIFMFALLFGIFLSSLLVSDCEIYHPKSVTANVFAQVLKQPVLIVFFIGCFLMQFSHGPYYAFFSLYVQDYGYSSWDIGVLWNLGVVAEVLIFLVMHRLMACFSLKTITVASLGLAGLRWVLTAYFVSSLPVLVLAQCLHAASFGSFHACAVEVIRRLFASRYRGRAMALYSGLSYGAGGAAGAVVSGWLWVWQPQAAFLVAAFGCFLAMLLTLFIRARSFSTGDEKTYPVDIF